MYELSNQKSGRSQLIFVASNRSTESIGFHDLKRAREPVSRSKRGVQGKVADTIHNRSRHAESQNELKAFQVLLATGRADHWQEQPFVLKYHQSGAKHRYTPDLLAVWNKHLEVVEIKDDQEAGTAENQEHFAVIRDLLAEYGYRFRVWLSSEIYAQPRLTNVGSLLRYRCVDVLPMERENIRRRFTGTPTVCLSSFSDQEGIAIQSVLRMVLEGILHINWWEPLTISSQISCTPIGPQVWPFPPSDMQAEHNTGGADAGL